MTPHQANATDFARVVDTLSGVLVHGQEPAGPRADAIEYARYHAGALMHLKMNPSPIAMRGLYPPHRPVGTPSRDSRAKAQADLRFAMQQVRMGIVTAPRVTAPRRAAARGA